MVRMYDHWCRNTIKNLNDYFEKYVTLDMLDEQCMRYTNQIEMRKVGVNHSQVSRHKKAQFFRGSGYFVCSQYKASASLGVSILSVPCGLFVL